ncbi:hypothetical protein DRQ50_06290 [bacterium]|nr:MAG: hypothetical protein DRQ50_06290 [bacterium]
MNPRHILTCLFLVLLSAGIGVVPASAQWFVSGGMNRSDLGLNDVGTGFQVGGGEIRPLPGDSFDVVWSLEYVQRRASQPMIFDDPDRGPVFGDAEVTLGYLQPAAMLGWRLPLGGLLLRPYGGASIAVKISENWEKPTGSTNRVYAYEDLDVMVHAGVTVGWRRLLVDVRGSWGVLEQVIDLDYDNAGGCGRADDALEGVKVPQAGDKSV